MDNFISRCVLLFALSVLILLGRASAEAIIGVSPADVYFSNVLRGGYAERYVSITLTSEEKVKMRIEPMGEIREWMNFSENSYYVDRNNPWRLLLSVSPPRDMPNGNYAGFVRISTESVGSGGKEGHAVGAIRAVIDLAVSVEVVDKEIFSCIASNFEARSVEKGDSIWFLADILNEGNVRIRPKITADIWDVEQTSKVKSVEHIGFEILPTKKERISFKVPSESLDIGQYWVNLAAPDCYDFMTLTFDVLEEGALRADGTIIGMVSKIWADIGETIPVYVIFKNTGEKEVDAQFRGKIDYGEEIFLPLESPKISVSVNEINNFTFYFTPEKAGKYVASGRVFYDRKRTFESSTIINIRPREITLRTVLILIGYFLIAVLAVILIYKIKSEKIRYLEKLKRIKRYEQ